jgi:hypothetical protein
MAQPGVQIVFLKTSAKRLMDNFLKYSILRLCLGSLNLPSITGLVRILFLVGFQE